MEHFFFRDIKKNFVKQYALSSESSSILQIRNVTLFKTLTWIFLLKFQKLRCVIQLGTSLIQPYNTSTGHNTLAPCQSLGRFQDCIIGLQTPKWSSPSLYHRSSTAIGPTPEAAFGWQATPLTSTLSVVIIWWLRSAVQPQLYGTISLTVGKLPGLLSVLKWN